MYNDGWTTRKYMTSPTKPQTLSSLVAPQIIITHGANFVVIGTKLASLWLGFSHEICARFAFCCGWILVNFTHIPQGYFTTMHCSEVIMSAMVSQITGVLIFCSAVCSGAYKKHQISASLDFVRGIHRGTVGSPYKGPVTRKMFPFDDVIMNYPDKMNEWDA